MPATRTRLSALALVVSLCICVAASPSSAQINLSREQVTEPLMQIQQKGAGLNLSLNSSPIAPDQVPDVEIGENLRLEVEVSTAGHLTTVHVDAQGTMRILTGSDASPSVAVEAGRRVTLPLSGAEWKARLPNGLQDLFVFLTSQPLTWAQLAYESDPRVEIHLTLHESGAVARSLSKVLTSAQVHSAGHRRFNITLRAHGEAVTRGGGIRGTGQSDSRGAADPGLTAQDVIDFFKPYLERTGTRGGVAGTNGVRGKRGPMPSGELNMPITFQSNSAQLDDAGKRNLNEIATAFKDEMFTHATFEIHGHTDDVGGDLSNMRLSLLRAEAVYQYMVGEKGIDSKRFILRAFGESSPMVNGQTEGARSSNRRVVFSCLY